MVTAYGKSEYESDLDEPPRDLVIEVDGKTYTANVSRKLRVVYFDCDPFYTTVDIDSSLPTTDAATSRAITKFIEYLKEHADR